ncbi:MotA/TolQ/ExbB proton channel family protein [Mangrovibacterium lignilyticum]|uniref:MotA/TolQ/ExbB proton channel family protein n=1 Tax=Mangrovibacterium lignilyticum TaxID=2668052 RepID=UPI0013D3F6AC|nr:MotA/TolQ/ExbB proton channel family protein [Mangrovibacterium lignilyticum]
MANLFNILNDGGILISYPILILVIVVLILFTRAMLGKADFAKTKSLLVSIGWFCLVWGYLGRTIGLIAAFDKIQAAGDISPSMFATHLKMALVGPLVGIFAFLVARLLIIILIATQKKAAAE